MGQLNAGAGATRSRSLSRNDAAKTHFYEDCSDATETDFVPARSHINRPGMILQKLDGDTWQVSI